MYTVVESFLLIPSAAVFCEDVESTQSLQRQAPVLQRSRECSIIVCDLLLVAEFELHASLVKVLTHVYVIW